jgi:outer membrane protein insertion porin family
MKKLFTALALLLVLGLSHANESFVIDDIRLEGLERITPGTVFSYLPLSVGDEVTQRSLQQSIRSLYRTGFFNDIEAGRQGSILVLSFSERPAIADITLEGNRDIEDEDLLNALAGIGLSEGEVFNQLELSRVEQELVRQYHSRGKYNVVVTTNVFELPRNRVNVSIKVAEGKPARIKSINVVGNQRFEQDEIIKSFESSTTNWLSWWTRDDQYSREKLTGDLEKLRSFYLDRGHVDMSIESTQVSISPDKREIFVTANVREGEVFSISDVRLTGEFVFEEEVIRRLLRIEAGQTFSRKDVEASIENIKAVMANIGYAFAEVIPNNRIDRDNNEVEVTLLVDPGKRVLVRRVEFVGNSTTKDEVLRREVRQLEGAWYSQFAIDRTEVRLNRLGYFDDVTIETPRVPGTEDQVDLVVEVSERNTGSFQVGLAFSQIRGLILSTQLQESNFFGTGKNVGLGINTSKSFRNFQINYTNPYWTKAGVSRGFNLRYQDVNQFELGLDDYRLESATLGMNFGFPVSEIDRVNFGFNIEDQSITLGDDVSDFLREFAELQGSDFTFYSLQSRWVRDSRNRFFKPTRGQVHDVSLEVSLPGSSIDFYRLRYKHNYLWGLADGYTLSFENTIGYGDTYGDDEDFGLPFVRHFYAGGPSTVRGFRENSLGPRGDGIFTRPVGGDALFVSRTELVVPTPFTEDQNSTRLSLFTDWGSVFATPEEFGGGDLRGSAGISFLWQAPVGPIQVSWSSQFNVQPGDRTEALQFTFGNVF